MGKSRKKSESFQELGDAIRDVLKEVSNELFLVKEEALNQAADFMVGKLNEAAPKSEKSTVHRLSGSFSRTTKYKGVRYVASDFVNDNGIPVANLLEYATMHKRGKPFIRETFNKNIDNVISIITNKLKE